MNRWTQKKQLKICGKPDLTIYFFWLVFQMLNSGTTQQNVGHTYFALLTLRSAVYIPPVTLDNPQGETTQSNTRCSNKTPTLHAAHFIHNLTRYRTRTLHSHSGLHTAHFSHYTLFTLRTPHFPFHSPHFPLHTRHFPPHTPSLIEKIHPTLPTTTSYYRHCTKCCPVLLWATLY